MPDIGAHIDENISWLETREQQPCLEVFPGPPRVNVPIDELIAAERDLVAIACTDRCFREWACENFFENPIKPPIAEFHGRVANVLMYNRCNEGGKAFDDIHATSLLAAAPRLKRRECNGAPLPRSIQVKKLTPPYGVSPLLRQNRKNNTARLMIGPAIPTNMKV